MAGSAKLLLLLFVANSLYRPTSADSTTNDTEDILGEKVNEMSYSDIKDALGNQNNSDTNNDFDVVVEYIIDEALSEEPKKSTEHTKLIVYIVVFASGPILFVLTAILYCLVLACEKHQKKQKRKSSYGGE